MEFFKTPAYRFRVNGRNVGFFENDDAIHRISIVLVISCGRAKTIRIRQRILLKYSEVKTRDYCVRRGKALEFLSISLRDTVPIMHTREERLFFFPQKDLSRFCRSLGRLATLKASSTRLTAFVKVNSSQRSTCGTSPILRCDYWHIRPSQSLSTFLGYLLWSWPHFVPWFLSCFLSFFFNRAPPVGLWSSSSFVSFWCPSHCCVAVVVLVLY